jgi:hypothetical protein
MEVSDRTIRSDLDFLRDRFIGNQFLSFVPKNFKLHKEDNKFYDLIIFDSKNELSN